MRNRLPRLLFPLILSLGPLSATTAFAQASNAERPAELTEAEKSVAREHFAKGVELQTAGQYAPAFDQFQLAEAVFHAPTNLLHMGQCEERLGKLVTAAERYRTIVQTPLAEGAPEAFSQAVASAQAELAQLTARIPHLRVTINPPGATNFQVRIDGELIAPAQLRELVPVNPGPHTITLTVPGFAPISKQMAFREHQTEGISFRIPKSGGASVDVDAPSTAPPPVEPANVRVQAAAPMPPAPPPPAGRPVYVQPEPQVVFVPPPPPPPIHDTHLLLGLRLSADVPLGSLGAFANNQSDVMVAGGGAAANIGLQFARHYYIGLSFDWAEFDGVSANNVTLPGGATAQTSAASSQALNVVFGYIYAPNHVSFYGEVGAGYRWTELQLDDGNGNSLGTASLSGGEGEVSVGLWIPLSHRFRLLPKLTIAGGKYTNANYTDANSSSSAVSLNGASHGFLGIGVEGYYGFPM